MLRWDILSVWHEVCISASAVQTHLPVTPEALRDTHYFCLTVSHRFL
jgi:hypothetical protein